MPHDLEDENLAPAVTLTESPSTVIESANKPGDRSSEYQREFVIIPEDQHHNAPANLHPYTRPLTISDIESVVALENAAFTDPEERATREKVSFLTSVYISSCTRDYLPISGEALTLPSSSTDSPNVVSSA